jgi:hypothetical protein
MSDGNLRVLNVPSGAAVRRGADVVHTEFPGCSLIGRKNVCDVVLAHEERRVADMLAFVPSPPASTPALAVAATPVTTVKPLPAHPAVTQGKIAFLQPAAPVTPGEPILLSQPLSLKPRGGGAGRAQAVAVLLLVGVSAGLGRKTGHLARPRE